MIYVFDTNTFSDLFKSYYKDRFPSLWAMYDNMVENGFITSTREVRREIENGPVEPLKKWVNNNPQIFTTPNATEGNFIKNIYQVRHFQQNIERKKLLTGGLNADPFVIAKAASIAGTVVTLEKEVPNGAKIPNICSHFHIPCINLEEFMEAENWQF